MYVNTCMRGEAAGPHSDQRVGAAPPPHCWKHTCHTIHTYMHTYIHLQTYRHTFMNVCKYMHAHCWKHTCIHTHKPACIHAYIHTKLTYIYAYSYTHSLLRAFLDAYTHTRNINCNGLHWCHADQLFCSGQAIFILEWCCSENLANLASG
jgi:hypothetical protein